MFDHDERHTSIRGVVEHRKRQPQLVCRLSYRDVEAAVVDIDLRELANVNTKADLAALTPD